MQLFYCRKCGAPLRKSDRYCPRCGTKTVDPPEMTEEAAREQIGILLEYINRKQAAQRQSDPNLRCRALELVAEIGASVTMLQRKMEIGAVEAELLIDWMAQKGYIARPDQKGWRVLFTPEQARTLDLGD